MTGERLRQVGREIKAAAAVVILVAASVVSAAASLAGLTTSVSVAATVAAVLSGYQVIWCQLIPPLRAKSAENSVQPVAAGGDGPWKAGTAFQIGPGRWITAARIVADAAEVVVRIQADHVPAQVIYQDGNVAVLSTSAAWPWTARTSLSTPDSGTQVKIIGCAVRGEDPYRGYAVSRYDPLRIRVSLYQTVLGTSETDFFVDGDVQPGLSGAPVLDVQSGKVIGVVHANSSVGDEPLLITVVRPISSIPTEYL
ncbi:serine protease [Streptomyces sp. NBC_00038]|uniref:S1 family peptidase n=1 Tax=Streptomyces sp. NBC_00038 TaxID=2903615 RepID=UPI002252FAFC|nr:serine protease [Streptomyces sp. NBC_00038]MCX5559484.1 serine protease [Streptomyces sp. NBC_00038]